MLKNMLTTNVAVGPVASKPTAIKNNNRIVPNATTQQATADNISTTGQNKPLKKSSTKFQHTLGKKIDPQTAQESQNKVEFGTKASLFQVFSAENQEQPVSVQEAITPEAALGEAVAANMDNSTQQQTAEETSTQPLQPTTVSETLQLSALLAQASEPVAIEPEPGQVVSATSGQETPATAGLVVPTTSDQTIPTISDQTAPVASGQVMPVISQTDDNLVQLTTEQNQIGSKVVLPETSSGVLTTDTDQPQGETANTVEKPAIAETPIVSDSPKPQLLNGNLPVAEPKVFVVQTNSVEIGSQDSAIVVEKSANSQVETSQQGQVLPESSGYDGKESQPAQSSLASEVVLKGSDSVQVQVSTGQQKDSDSSTSGNSSDSDTTQFSQIISSDDVQPFTTGQTFVSSQAVKTTADLSPSVGEQIQESISSSLSRNDQQITIRLNPPELGKVFIKFQAQENEITGILEVSKAQTRYEVEQALPEVIRNLADSGIEVRRLEVVISDTEQSQQQAAKDQSLASRQNGWFGQNSSQDSNTHPDNSGSDETNQWLTNTYDNTGLTELEQMFVTDKSINMLV
ncbi:MAG: flagellar hook-length control protein FliK [Planctomycetota bacterium]